MYELYLVYSEMEDEANKTKNIQTAYTWLIKSLNYGVTQYDDAINYFKKHFSHLNEWYVALKKLPLDATSQESQADVLRIHEANVNEIKNDFSAALGKDRLYHKPAGFINDQ